PGGVLTLIVRLCVIVVMVALPGLAQEAAAQTPPVTPQAQTPAQPAPLLPPTNIGPVLRGIELRIVPENVFTVVPSETYLYYIRTRASTPRDTGTWVPYNEATEASLLAHFDQLFTTPFIDDLRIEVIDNPYPNGVLRKN